MSIKSKVIQSINRPVRRRKNSTANKAVILDDINNKRYKKMAITNECIKRIRKFCLDGYTIEETYKQIGSEIKEILGYDPLKTMEFVYKTTVCSKNKSDDDLER